MIQTNQAAVQPLPQQMNPPSSNILFVGPYRLEKTLGKGQTGTIINVLVLNL